MSDHMTDDLREAVRVLLDGLNEASELDDIIQVAMQDEADADGTEEWVFVLRAGLRAIAEGKDEISEALDRTWSGMYLRDWFAGQALAAMGKVICEDGSPDDLVIRPDTLSGWAYKYADAMLAARAKGGE